MPNRIALLAVLTVLVLALAACGGSAAATTTAPAGATTEVSGSPASASDLLTVADVEKVSGLTGIKTVEKGSQAGAGGDVNFVTAEGKLVVMASFYGGAQFDTFNGTTNFREPLSGLGDAAFVGPSKDAGAGDTLYEVAFKKGDHTALLVTYFKSGSMEETMLSMDQLKELAGIVASRL